MVFFVTMNFKEFRKHYENIELGLTLSCPESPQTLQEHIESPSLHCMQVSTKDNFSYITKYKVYLDT